MFLVHNENTTAGRYELDGLDSAEIWELFLFGRLQTVIRRNCLKLRIEWPRGLRAASRMLLEWQGRRTRVLIPDIIITESDGGGRTAILDAKYRHFVPPFEDLSVADQMALYAITAEVPVRPPSAAGATEPPTMLLVYPQANAGTNSKGLNNGREGGKIGEGRFLFQDRLSSRLIAWYIPLPEDEVKCGQAVEENLFALLKEAFPPR